MDRYSDINLQGDTFERVNTCKYLGATSAENGDLDDEKTHSPQSGGLENGKTVVGILCDRRISLRINRKVYRTLLRPAMMYGDTGSEENTR